MGAQTVAQLEKRTTWQTKAGGAGAADGQKRKKDNVMSYNTWGPLFLFSFCAETELLSLIPNDALVLLLLLFVQLIAML